MQQRPTRALCPQADEPDIYHHSSELPSLTEIRAANERLTQRELRVRQARSASIELAADAIAEFVPKAGKELISAFINELTSTLSKSALHEVVPSKVADVASARHWVKMHLTGVQAARRGAIADAWAFYPSSLEPKVGSGIHGAEVAVSALVARLNTQQHQIARDQVINRMRGPTSFEYAPSHPSGPHVRFRR